MIANIRIPNLIVPPVGLLVCCGLLGLSVSLSVALLLSIPLLSLILGFSLIGAAIGTMAGSYIITSLTENAQWGSLLIGQAIGLCAFASILFSVF